MKTYYSFSDRDSVRVYEIVSLFKLLKSLKGIKRDIEYYSVILFDNGFDTFRNMIKNDFNDNTDILISDFKFGKNDINIILRELNKYNIIITQIKYQLKKL